MQMAMTVEDAWALRVRAYETLNLPLRTCPGRKTVLMIRGEDVAAAKRQYACRSIGVRAPGRGRAS